MTSIVITCSDGDRETEVTRRRGNGWKGGGGAHLLHSVSTTCGGLCANTGSVSNGGFHIGCVSNENSLKT